MMSAKMIYSLVTVTMGLLQIYALNKVMTDLEYKNFEELVKTKGLNV